MEEEKMHFMQLDRVTLNLAKARFFGLMKSVKRLSGGLLSMVPKDTAINFKPSCQISGYFCRFYDGSRLGNHE